VTADNPDSATLAEAERELFTAFGLPAPAALAEARPSVEAPVDADKAAAAVVLAEIAPAFGVNPESLPRPLVAPPSPVGLSPTPGEGSEALTESVRPLREPAASRKTALAGLGEGTVQERLERVEVLIREVM
jgi:hypothetical protein